MPTGQWFNPSVVFTAQESTVTLSFRALAGSDVSYPTEFWVDAVLVEARGDPPAVFRRLVGHRLLVGNRRHVRAHAVLLVRPPGSINGRGQRRPDAAHAARHHVQLARFQQPV